MPVTTIELIDQTKVEVNQPLPKSLSITPRFTMRVYLSKMWDKVWPILVLVLSPALFICRIIVVSYLRWYAYTFLDRQVNPRAKCPSCGIKQGHVIQYSRDYEAVIHVCGQCKAEWAEPTVLPVERWRIKQSVENNAEQEVNGKLW